jgi:cytochrome bd ubiquinol oxidase subunit I
MEGVFSFFLESAFLGLLLFGEKHLSPLTHWASALLVFVGSWISGFFIIVANAWMQHPVAYRVLPNDLYQVTSFWGLLTNPWALIQYTHTMSGAVITGSFVMCALGAFYMLENRFPEHGKIFLRVGVIAGLISCATQIFPTGDMHGRYVAKHQPAALAAMEGLFNSQRGAAIVMLGQPDVERQTIDNPLAVNDVLSFLIYGTTKAEVRGLDQVPRDHWPEPVPLLFYAYHIMAGLGTYFVLLMAIAGFLLWRGKLFTTRWALWPLMLSFPLPYIANTAGWMTAEIGRQPWVVYGLIRTSSGYSKYVGVGNSLFTLLGFMGALQRRSRIAARRLWMAVVGLTIVSVPATIIAGANVLSNYRSHPVLFVIPVVVALALLGIIHFLRKESDHKAFTCSCLYLGSMLVGAAVALYPCLLPSSDDPARDITTQKALAGPHTLHIGLVWWAFGMCLALTYFVIVYRMFAGKSDARNRWI